MGKESRTRVLGDHQAMAVARNIRVSPRKLNLVAQQIRGLDDVGTASDLWALAASAFASAAGAFTHVVKPGETLAQIAERVYGDVAEERLLVSANGLDEGGGVAIAPGLVLEVPALGHHRAAAGETWASLARARPL